jgi:hypothetical protein
MIKAMNILVKVIVTYMNEKYRKKKKQNPGCNYNNKEKIELLISTI